MPLGWFGKLGARISGKPQAAEEIIVSNTEQHNEVYQRGAGLISRLMKLHGREPRLSKRDKQAVLEAIRDLDAVTNYKPGNWAAFWIKGKGYQTLSDHRAARAEFQAAFAIQKENPDVAREYAYSCMELGDGEEAVAAARHAVGLSHGDAGLLANLALALLVSGEHAEAKARITESLQLAPSDPISKAVERVLNEVLAGRRKQPKVLADLQRP